MLQLFQSKRAWGAPNISPFCIKLELYLRIHKLEYEIVPADPRKAPKGKIPYVNLDGEVLGDSQLIIDRLTEKFGNAIDGHLTPLQHAQGHTLRRMLEEGTYFIGMYNRWWDDAGFVHIQAEFSKFVPMPWVLLKLIRNKVKKTLYLQGTARHTADELTRMAARDVKAAATLLGDKPFIFGEQVSSYDAYLFPWLEAALCFPQPGPVSRAVEAESNLMAYHARIKQLYFSDIRPKKA